jgi:hypothetical protein
MWPILEKIQWAAENNIYSTAFGWNILLNLFDLWCNLTLKFLCWFCKVSFILWVASLQNMDYLWYLPFLISIFKVDMVNNPLVCWWVSKSLKLLPKDLHISLCVYFCYAGRNQVHNIVLQRILLQWLLTGGPKNLVSRAPWQQAPFSIVIQWLAQLSAWKMFTTWLKAF